MSHNLTTIMVYVMAILSPYSLLAESMGNWVLKGSEYATQKYATLA